MIEAFATNGANQKPLDVGSLPRRAREEGLRKCPCLHVFSEVIAKDRIAVAQR